VWHRPHNLSRLTAHRGTWGTYAALSQSSACSRSRNHLVGKTAGPSTASFPASGNPAGITKANLRTPAAPYRGMMWASRHSMTPGANLCRNSTASMRSPRGLAFSASHTNKQRVAMKPPSLMVEVVGSQRSSRIWSFTRSMTPQGFCASSATMIAPFAITRDRFSRNSYVSRRTLLTARLNRHLYGVKKEQTGNLGKVEPLHAGTYSRWQIPHAKAARHNPARSGRASRDGHGDYLGQVEAGNHLYAGHERHPALQRPSPPDAQSQPAHVDPAASRSRAAWDRETGPVSAGPAPRGVFGDQARPKP